jgi:hypothetical protein
MEYLKYKSNTSTSLQACMNFLEKIQHKHKARSMILKEEEDTIPGPAGMLRK